MSINYFNEFSKLECRRKNQEFNFLDYFNLYILPRKDFIREYFATGKLPEYTTCSDYNPEWSYTLLKHFNARRVLDMSAGRGARMLGAMLAGCDYYLGIDPNEKSNEANYSLYYFYKHMLDIKTKVELINSPYEKPWERDRTDELFDILITSPPYFDLEIYVPSYDRLYNRQDQYRKKNKDKQLEKAQSIYNRTLEQWINDFLIVSICKTAKMIKRGGHILINMDISVNVELWMDYVSPLITSKKIKEAGLEYIGYYAVNSLKVPCAFWTFRLS